MAGAGALTHAEILQIQSDCFADDVAFDSSRMQAESWSAALVQAFFESGGESAPPAAPKPPVADAADGIDLVAYGKERFARAPARVFRTRAGVALVYQLAEAPGGSTKAPVVILGGGMTGRHEACAGYGAESAFKDHPVLIFDRRNTGASDVCYDGIGGGSEQHASENHAQVADLAELLVGLGLPPCILYGHSSGARLFGMLAIAHPHLVKALVLCILTGGKTAAKNLGYEYYGRHIRSAEAGGMAAVLADRAFGAAAQGQPLGASGARLNRRAAPYLQGLEVAAYVQAMRASQAFYAATKGEPALGLPAASLAALRAPTLCVNYYPPADNDGMHTPEVTRAVAAAVPTAGPAVVSEELAVWFGAVAKFVAAHA